MRFFCSLLGIFFLNNELTILNETNTYMYSGICVQTDASQRFRSFENANKGD